ncbi:MAG: hypothetical protein CBE00_09795 [Planctomycetaceae bacterium TMED240]|nr:hypothetical protein [Rhodopirellula sp.]OUX05681.1 MAG: hypothetical protein CBE00_09795 [Planctomycetaceae bacterium TMED240]
MLSGFNVFWHVILSIQLSVWPNISYTPSLVSWFPARVCTTKIEDKTANWKTKQCSSRVEFNKSVNIFGNQSVLLVVHGVCFTRTITEDVGKERASSCRFEIVSVMLINR